MTPDEASEALRQVYEAVIAHQKEKRALGESILDEIAGHREMLDTAEKHGFCKILDEAKIDAILEYVQARAKDYCGEEE